MCPVSTQRKRASFKIHGFPANQKSMAFFSALSFLLLISGCFAARERTLHGSLVRGEPNVCEDRGEQLICCPGYAQATPTDIGCSKAISRSRHRRGIGSNYVLNWTVWDYEPKSKACIANGCDKLADLCNQYTGACMCDAGRTLHLQEDGSIKCAFGCYTDYQFGLNCSETCTLDCGQDRNAGYCEKLDAKACVCYPGWKGKNCETPCPAFRFGAGCKQTCNISCLSHIGCSNIGGCVCPSGFKTDLSCHIPCEPGTWGMGCKQQCACQNNATCNRVIGCNCSTIVGFTGPTCTEPCPDGYFGRNCSQKCVCAPEVQGTCDRFSGKCGQCPDGYYGNGTTCSVCTCLTNKTSMRCHKKINSCWCKPGYAGDKCKPCPAGFYGDRCRQECTIKCANGGKCFHEDGVSCICPAGFHGDTCQFTCPSGTFGTNCSRVCANVCPFGTCDHVDGSCRCANATVTVGYGRYCEEPCADGWYLSAGGACVMCNCSEDNSISRSCNVTTGRCACNPGWSVNSDCYEYCPSGYYGASCQHACTCDNGSCHHVNGTCDCNSGYSGKQCNQPCQSSKFGKNCKSVCECHSPGTQSCSSVSGQCTCKAGWTGVTCSLVEPELTVSTTVNGNSTSGEGAVNGYSTSGEGTVNGNSTSGEGTVNGNSTSGEGTVNGNSTSGEGTVNGNSTSGEASEDAGSISLGMMAIIGGGAFVCLVLLVATLVLLRMSHRYQVDVSNKTSYSRQATAMQDNPEYEPTSRRSKVSDSAGSTVTPANPQYGSFHHQDTNTSHGSEHNPQYSFAGPQVAESVNSFPVHCNDSVSNQQAPPRPVKSTSVQRPLSCHSMDGTTYNVPPAAPATTEYHQLEFFRDMEQEAITQKATLDVVDDEKPAYSTLSPTTRTTDSSAGDLPHGVAPPGRDLKVSSQVSHTQQQPDADRPASNEDTNPLYQMFGESSQEETRPVYAEAYQEISNSDNRAIPDGSCSYSLVNPKTKKRPSKT